MDGWKPGGRNIIQASSGKLSRVRIATLIVRRKDATIYASQLRTRNDSPAHRLQFGLPLLSNVTVSEVMGDELVVMRAESSIAEGLSRLLEAHLPGSPVVDANGVFLGVVTVRSLEEAADAAAKMALRRVMDVTAPTVQASAALDVAFDALSTTSETWVSVTDSLTTWWGSSPRARSSPGTTGLWLRIPCGCRRSPATLCRLSCACRKEPSQPDRPFVTPLSRPGPSLSRSSGTEPSSSPTQTRHSSLVI